MFSRNKIKIISDACCGIIMLLSILTFILIGVFKGVWHPTWIILVVASITCGVISIIIGTFCKVKKISSNDNLSNHEEI